MTVWRRRRRATRDAAQKEQGDQDKVCAAKFATLHTYCKKTNLDGGNNALCRPIGCSKHDTCFLARQAQVGGQRNGGWNGQENGGSGAGGRKLRADGSINVRTENGKGGSYEGISPDSVCGTQAAANGLASPARRAASGVSEWGVASDGTAVNSRDQLLSHQRVTSSQHSAGSPHAQVSKLCSPLLVSRLAFSLQNCLDCWSPTYSMQDAELLAQSVVFDVSRKCCTWVFWECFSQCKLVCREFCCTMETAGTIRGMQG